MTITIQEIEEAFSRTVFGRPPKEIFILDGVVSVKRGGRTRTAIAMTRPQQSIAVFTPASKSDSPYHELLHSGLFGLGILGGEFIAELGGKLLDLKNQIMPGIPKRRVKYKLCEGCQSTDVILDRLDLKPGFEGQPVIRHYILVEDE